MSTSSKQSVIRPDPVILSRWYKYVTCAPDARVQSFLEYTPLLLQHGGYCFSGEEFGIVITVPALAFYLDKTRKKPHRLGIREYMRKTMGLESWPRTAKETYLVWSNCAALLPMEQVEIITNAQALYESRKVWDWIEFVCGLDFGKQSNPGLVPDKNWIKQRPRAKVGLESSYSSAMGSPLGVSVAAAFSLTLQSSYLLPQ